MIATDFSIGGQKAWENINCPRVRFEGYVVKRQTPTPAGYITVEILGVFSGLKEAVELAKQPRPSHDIAVVVIEDYAWVMLPGDVRHTLQISRVRRPDGGW